MSTKIKKIPMNEKKINSIKQKIIDIKIKLEKNQNQRINYISKLSKLERDFEKLNNNISQNKFKFIGIHPTQKEKFKVLQFD